MQIDNSSVQVFDDLANNIKRSGLQFTAVDSVTFQGGADGGSPIRISNVSTPLQSTDVANKAYVDATIQGMTIKTPVKVLGDSHTNLASYIVGAQVDGVQLAAGDRFLLIGQQEAKENGIWVISENGDPIRPSDFANDSNASGVYCFVDEGSEYLDRSFICISNTGSDRVGVNDLQWVQFGARPSAMAGYGLKVGSGNEMDVDNLVIPTLSDNNTFAGTQNSFDNNLLVGGALNVSGTQGITAQFVTGLDKSRMTNASPNAAVSVSYVTDRINQFAYKIPVQCVSTDAITSPPQTNLVSGMQIDGMTTTVGDRVLLKNQNNPIENGIYVIEANGSSRAIDMPTGYNAHGTFMFTCCGTLNGDQVFVNTNSHSQGSIVGTHALNFSGLVTQSQTLAGSGLVPNSTALDVNTDNITLEVDTDQVRIKDLGITDAKIADGTISNSKLANKSISVITNRGLTGGNGDVDLGGAVSISVNTNIVPNVDIVNTFTQNNTFGESVTVGKSLSVGQAINAPKMSISDTAQITDPSSAVNVDYLQTELFKLRTKAPVRAASTGPLSLTVLLPNLVVDGITLQADDRVLLKDQSSATENGIYIVQSASPAVRSADLPTGSIATGCSVVVTDGIVNGDRLFLCTSPDDETQLVGSNSLTFKSVGSSTQQLAGDGLVSSGDTLMVSVDDTTIEIHGDAIRIKDAGIENQKLAHPGIGVSLGTGLTGSNSVDLGASATINIDHTVVPNLGSTNTFTEANTFQKSIEIQDQLNVLTKVTAPKFDGIQTVDTPDSAVSLAYFDTTINAMAAKATVRVATTQNIDISSLQPNAMIDGVQLRAEDRVLVHLQTNQVDNGVYVVPSGSEPVMRSADMTSGHVGGCTVTVIEGLAYGDRIYMCIADALSDSVGVSPLIFTAVGQSAPQLAGQGLIADGNKVGALVDDNTIEIDPSTSSIRLKNLGITDSAIADATITNGKLQNDNINIKPGRGLSGGGVTALGGEADIIVNHNIIPDLTATNTFAQINTFSGGVQSTSQSTGTVVVTGGVGVSGDIFCNSTFNMSDKRLKNNVKVLDNALDIVSNLSGYSFTWNELMPAVEGKETVGVLAQEVKSWAPMCTNTDPESGYLSVEYTKLVPYLIESVKTLKRKVDELTECQVPAKRQRTKRADKGNKKDNHPETTQSPAA